MKQKDILLIVVIGIVSAVFALVLSNLLISNNKTRSQTAEVVEPISNQFLPPDPDYFNNNSIDPTKLIRIGDDTNDQPFNQ